MELILSLWNSVLRWFDVIPKLTYFILVCFMSVIDIMQFMFRKIVGLDVYYIGQSNNPQTGDIALAFIRSIFEKNSAFPALRNAFWALIILGIILLIVTTIIAIIRQEYMPGQEETKAKDKNNKIFILTRSVKSLFLFLIVPVSAIFGLMLGDIFLQALDRATTSSGSSLLFTNASVTNKLESVEVNGITSYSFYDIFGGSLPTNSTSFSGQMFKSSAFTSNRIRLNETYDDKTFYNLIKDGDLSNFGIFNTADGEVEMAEMIDDAFANNVRFKEGSENYIILGPMKDQLDTDLWGIKGDTYNVKNFSKFNVSLVWYYYNLWFFNYIVGFAFFIVAAKLFANLILGLAKRIIEIVALFIISPPIIAIMPLDEGKAFQNWRKAFLGRAVAAYGVVLGFNIIFLIMPYLNLIRIFPSGNFGYELINVIVSTVFAILCLQVVQGFMGMLSKMVGAEDVAESGGKMVEQVGSAVKKSAMLVGAAAGLAVGAVGGAAAIAGKVAGGAGKFVGGQVKKGMDARAATKRANETPAQKLKREAKEQRKQENAKKAEDRKEKREEFFNKVKSVGFGKKLDETSTNAKNDWERGGADEQYNEMMQNDEKYNKEIDDEYAKYQENNGEQSKEEWLRSKDSKEARAKAEDRFAKRKGMDRNQHKNNENLKNAYIKDRVDEKRKSLVTARQNRVANAFLTQTGLANTQTIGELFTEEMKDTFVRGGAKGGFPALISMFNGGMAEDVIMAGIKKKIQKEQMMRTKTQMEIQKELEEKDKK